MVLAQTNDLVGYENTQSGPDEHLRFALRLRTMKHRLHCALVAARTLTTPISVAYAGLAAM
jgi:hypothetical protein